MARLIRADDARAVLRAAPVRSFEEIVGAAPLLVLAPHPDDESLGCGGLIAEAAAREHAVYVAILTDGGFSHPGSPTWPRERLVKAREGEARAAVACLGLPNDRLFFLGHEDGAAPTEGRAFDGAVDRLAGLLTRHGIGTVCAAWQADPHCDHAAGAHIAACACVRAGARRLSYPVWSLTLPDDAPVPDPAGRAMRFEMARHLEAKRHAIASHATQHAGLIDDDPHGFALPETFLALFDGPHETFIAEP